MTENKPANKRIAGKGKRGGMTRTSWKPGQSGNPKGRPALGESYKEIFAAVGNLTVAELRERYPVYGDRFDKAPDDAKLKDLVVLSVLAALAIEPTPGMLATLLDRTDGPLEHTINLNKMSDDEVANVIKPILERVGIGLEAPDASGLPADEVRSDTITPNV